METHLGAQLKRAREAAGLSLKEIATRTKISATALEAVERNDFSRLPGGIFGRSFVRAYALEVGLDPDAVVVSFVDALEQNARESAARDAIRPEITADDRRFLERQRRALLWLRIGVAAAVLALLVFVVWRFGGLSGGERSDSTQSVDAVPTSTAPSGGFAPPPSAPVGAAPAPVGAAPAPAPPAAPGAAGDRAEAPGANRAAGGAADAEAGASAPETPALASPAASGEAGAAPPLVFDLALTGDCWISYSVDGGPPVSQLFRAGDRRRIQVTRELMLDVGNAGALTVTINGKRARPLGGSGDHVRRRITREDVVEGGRILN